MVIDILLTGIFFSFFYIILDRIYTESEEVYEKFEWGVGVVPLPTLPRKTDLVPEILIYFIENYREIYIYKNNKKMCKNGNIFKGGAGKNIHFLRDNAITAVKSIWIKMTPLW